MFDNDSDDQEISGLGSDFDESESYDINHHDLIMAKTENNSNVGG